MELVPHGGALELVPSPIAVLALPLAEPILPKAGDGGGGFGGRAGVDSGARATPAVQGQTRAPAAVRSLKRTVKCQGKAVTKRTCRGV